MKRNTKIALAAISAQLLLGAVALRSFLDFAFVGVLLLAALIVPAGFLSGLDATIRPDDQIALEIYKSASFETFDLYYRVKDNSRYLCRKRHFVSGVQGSEEFYRYNALHATNAHLLALVRQDRPHTVCVLFDLKTKRSWQPLRTWSADSHNENMKEGTAFLSALRAEYPEKMFALAGTEEDFAIDRALSEAKWTENGGQQALGENGEPAPAFGGSPKTTLPAEPAGELDSPADAVSQP